MFVVCCVRSLCFFLYMGHVGAAFGEPAAACRGVQS